MKVAKFTPNESERKALLSPYTDWLTIGGLSILLLPVAFLVPFDDADTEKWAWALYAIAFVVNYPHFTVSYQLMYGDYRFFILKDLRFFWAGIIVPVLMGGYITAAHIAQSYEMLQYFVQFMFVIVGWHYTKQAYGVIMVTSSMKGYYYNVWERWILKINMYSLWLTSFLFFNIGLHEQPDYWGIQYYSLNFPKEALYISYGITTFTLLTGLALILYRVVRERKWPPVIAIVGLGSIYAWFLPVWFNPIYFLATPLFHSIQYFTFVLALKKNEVWEKTHRKKAGIQAAFWYYLIAVISGIMLFEAIPRLMGKVLDYNHELFGDGLFLFLFSVFINIHHYFIDNVIWRKDNPKVSKYLFRKEYT